MENKKKEIDIILPNYNSVNFIEQTLKSIISQSFKNWRLIIVSSSVNFKTGEYVKIRKSFAPYLSFISLKYFKSLSPSKSKASEDASNLKSLEKYKKKDNNIAIRTNVNFGKSTIKFL